MTVKLLPRRNNTGNRAQQSIIGEFDLFRASLTMRILFLYSNFRKYAHPLHVKEGIITEKVFPVFSESFFWTCFGLVMYIWELMGVTEKLAFQM